MAQYPEQINNLIETLSRWPGLGPKAAERVVFYLMKQNSDNIKLLINNIAYAFQTTDLFNYLLNRFYIGLSVGKIFFKFAIINSFSILEGILYGVIKNEHKFCANSGEVCKYNEKCKYYLKSPNKYPFLKMLETLKEKEILIFSRTGE